MKKFALYLATAMLLLAVTPVQSMAATKPVTISNTEMTKTNEAEANALLLRLREIKAMKISSLNSSEKKKLRTEVRAIKHQLNDLSGGVYLSVGAIIIIVLLLILLL